MGVLLLLGREALALVPYQRGLLGRSPASSRFRDRCDELGAAARIDDLLGRLTGFVELPVPAGALVGRVQYRPFEERVAQDLPPLASAVPADRPHRLAEPGGAVGYPFPILGALRGEDLPRRNGHGRGGERGEGGGRAAAVPARAPPGKSSRTPAGSGCGSRAPPMIEKAGRERAKWNGERCIVGASMSNECPFDGNRHAGRKRCRASTRGEARFGTLLRNRDRMPEAR